MYPLRLLALAAAFAAAPAGAADLSGWFESQRGRESEASCAHWIAQARAGADADLQYRVGLCYANGWGVPEDRLAADAWLARAAERGHPEAQMALADSHLAASETRAAYRWYAIAAEGNHPGAAIRRDRIGALIDPAAAESIRRDARAWRPRAN